MKAYSFYKGRLFFMLACVNLWSTFWSTFLKCAYDFIGVYAQKRAFIRVDKYL